MHPEIRCKLNRVYNAAFYGFNIWDLASPAAISLYNSWSTAIRIMWGIPRTSHRRFLEPLGGKHTQCIIFSNYWNFVRSLSVSNIHPVRNTAYACLFDARTLTARNIDTVRLKLGIQRRHTVAALDWDPHTVTNMRFMQQEIDDLSRVSSIKDLVNAKRGEIMIFDDSTTNEELDFLLHDICCN